MLTDSTTDPFLISQALTERNKNRTAWLSGQAGRTEDKQVDRYIEVIDRGGSKEEAEEAFRNENKNVSI